MSRSTFEALFASEAALEVVAAAARHAPVPRGRRVLTGCALRALRSPRWVAAPRRSWPRRSAAALLITLPVLVFVFLVQRQMVRGLTAGGLR